MFLARRTFALRVATPLVRRFLSSRASAVLDALDITTDGAHATLLPSVYDDAWSDPGDVLQSVCPSMGEVLAHVASVRLSVSWCTCPRADLVGGMAQASPEELQCALERTRKAHVHFRSVPAPQRSEIVRQIREALTARPRLLRPCLTSPSTP
ncbi:hypothetical protein BC834DRAFT_77779 [Gloeopeniophorella convolvens]|nr:hypothetical protein BC834DRAFT_77779 [Gloeopeniophorella convolvens]